jgi:hypothetical protein
MERSVLNIHFSCPSIASKAYSPSSLPKKIMPLAIDAEDVTFALNFHFTSPE